MFKVLFKKCSQSAKFIPNLVGKTEKIGMKLVNATEKIVVFYKILM